MENHEVDPITAFDALYTSNQLQILKVALPYMQPKMQSLLAIYIKLSELMIAFRFSKSNALSDYSASDSKELDLLRLLRAVSPYLSEAEQEMAKQFVNLQENMEQFKQMSQMMQLMKDMGDGSCESVLQNFLSEEQMEMLKGFEADFS